MTDTDNPTLTLVVARGGGWEALYVGDYRVLSDTEVNFSEAMAKFGVHVNLVVVDDPEPRDFPARLQDLETDT